LTFVFYDTETTGTDTTFDQILQFAAITTDDDLVEHDRFETRCRLQPHIIPSPTALAITRVTPDMLTDPATPSHYEAMRAIGEKLRDWSPACFAGYNSLAFDERLLRQAFYQTLQPTYLTNTGGNTRADIYRMVQAATIHAPDALELPVDEAGRPSRRLDALAPANGFNHADAHEALSDVEATIFIARLIRDRAPVLWSDMMEMATKAHVTDRVMSGNPLVQTEVYGRSVHNRLIVGVAPNPNYNAQIVAFDLSHDLEPLLELSVEELVETLNAKLKPLRVIQANAQPILLDAAHVRAEILQDLPDRDHAARRIRAILDNHEFCARVGQAVSQRFPDTEPSEWVEEQIFDGFTSSADNRLMDAFHAADPEMKQQIAAQFEDRRLRELAHRIINTESPDYLEPKIREWFEDWQTKRIVKADNAGKFRSLGEACDEARKLTDEPGRFDPELLRKVSTWLSSIEA
jgi:exodeoxyribonuclease-1